MSTFGDLISDVDTGVRETTTEKGAYLIAAAGRLWQNYLRLDNWPQTRVTGTTISIVSGTAAYDLPADFDRFAGDRVFINLSTPANYPGIGIPILARGSVQADRIIEYWSALNYGVTATSPWGPSVATVQSGGANTYQLRFYPTPSPTGATVAFDYYAVPQRSAITTGATMTVDQLYETMFHALTAEYMRYLNHFDAMQVSMQLARSAHRTAQQTLNSL